MAGKPAVWGPLVGLAVAVVGILIGAGFLVLFPGCSYSVLGVCVVPNLLQGTEQAITGGSLVVVGLVVAIAYGRPR